MGSRAWEFLRAAITAKSSQLTTTTRLIALTGEVVRAFAFTVLDLFGLETAACRTLHDYRALIKVDIIRKQEFTAAAAVYAQLL